MCMTFYTWMTIRFSDVNECQSQPCQNGGSCIDRQGYFECRCRFGYNGPTCQYGKLNSLESVPEKTLLETFCCVHCS